MRPPLLMLVGLLLALRCTAQVPAAQPGLDSVPSGVAAPHARILLNGTWLCDGTADQPEGSTRVPETAEVEERPLRVVRRMVSIPRAWRGAGRVLLHFEKASHHARVTWNGRVVGEHFGARNAFDVDVTREVDYEGANRLEVQLDSAWTGHAGPNDTSTAVTDVLWYVTETHRSRHAAITGDVWVSLVPEVSVGPPHLEASLRSGKVTATFTVTNDGDRVRDVEVAIDVARAGEDVAHAAGPRIRLLPGAQRTLKLSTLVSSPLPWGPAGFGTPTLYDLALSLREGATTVERRWTHFGFRDIAVGPDGRFSLNGRPLFIVGRRVVFQTPCFDEPHSLRAAFLLMQRCGFNAVELHEESRPSFFYDVADEVGMLVISGNFCLGELGGKHMSSHPPGEKALRDAIRAWASSEQSHPSVVLFNPCLGVSILGDLIPDATLEAVSNRLVSGTFPAMGIQVEAGPPLPLAVPTLLGEINLHGTDPQRVADFFEQLGRRSDLLGIVVNSDFGRFSTTPTAPFPSAAAAGGPRADAVDVTYQGPPVALDRVFDSHPQDEATLDAMRVPPEVLVRVTRAGQPVRALVMLVPCPSAHGAPRGAFTEADGTALVALPCDGPWRAECGGQEIVVQTHARRDVERAIVTFDLPL